MQVVICFFFHLLANIAFALRSIQCCSKFNELCLNKKLMKKIHLKGKWLANLF